MTVSEKAIQDVIVTGIVQAGVISDLGSGSTPLVSTRIQVNNNVN